jgi:hypothetical protein
MGGQCDDGIRRRLYLDVDGTLLRRGGHARLRGDLAPAPHLRRFLEWAIANFHCVWLTSRGRDGESANIRAAFRQAIGPGDEFDAIDTLLARVGTARWDNYKAEAIDFDHPFLWLDDAPEEESLTMLHQRGVADHWIPIAIDGQPDDLLRVMRQLG